MNVVPVFRKGKKEDPDNYRPGGVISVPSEMEKFILVVIEEHLRDNRVIGHSRYGFTRGKSCFPNLISLYDKVSQLVDQRKPVDVFGFLGFFFYFSKAFDTLSQSILLEKMLSTQLDKFAMHWVKQLADRLDLKTCSKWSYIRPVACHQWGSPGLSIRASAL